MSIKNKLRTGISFLFLLALLCSGFAVYYLQQLSNDSRAILKDNYRTLIYTKNISSLLDANTPGRLAEMQTNLVKQENNVTETGEKTLTDSLHLLMDQYKVAQANPILIQKLGVKMRSVINDLMTINMNAIQNKDQKANETSKHALIIIGLLGSFCFLIGFSFMVNFPGYIATPIRELTQSILAIANKNYNKRLVFNSKDEYGELSDAFNQMAAKLSEYETSSLADVLFEKKRIETIINSMHDALIGLDDKQTIIFVNDVACSLIGIPKEKLINSFVQHIAEENDLLRNIMVTDTLKMKNLC